MTWRQRLRQIDERSGLAQMQLDLVEFAAPFYALIALTCIALAIWQAIEHGWGATATFGGIAVVLTLVAVAGYRRRRRRDRQEDPGQPL